MNEQPLVVAEYAELMALHKALLEAKFHPNPENAYISGSPHVARIADATELSLIALIRDNQGNEKAEEWEAWLDLTNQRWVLDRVVKHMRVHRQWEIWDLATLYDYVRCMVSPFRCSMEHIEEIIELVRR